MGTSFEIEGFRNDRNGRRAGCHSTKGAHRIAQNVGNHSNGLTKNDTSKAPKRVLLRIVMLIVLVVTLLGSSATAWYTVGPGNVFRNVSQVRQGQTCEEVVRWLGEPDSKSWLDADSSEAPDVDRYGSMRENWFANYVSVCMMFGIVEPPEVFYPGFSLHFGGEGRLHHVTSMFRNVVVMITGEDK